MPEGDTVYLTAKRLHEALAGERVLASDFRLPQLATADVSGRSVLEVVPRGKHLLMRFDDGQTLHSHLRMD
ncbi:MAG: DNA glycosylase, partial [Pseudonocardiales bacterium]